MPYKDKEKRLAAMASWRTRNNEHTKEYDKKRYGRDRKKLYRLLGNKCVVCGEDDPIYFHIDHVNNDGNVDRKKGFGGGKRTKLKHYLETPERFQLMCANCNHAKQMNGGKIYKPKKRQVLDYSATHNNGL